MVGGVYFCRRFFIGAGLLGIGEIGVRLLCWCLGRVVGSFLVGFCLVF